MESYKKMTESKLIFVGLFASPINLSNTRIAMGYMCIEHGKITRKGSVSEFKNLEKAGMFANSKIIKLNHDQVLMPGFVDCHTHAPQFPNLGLGLDRPLLEWLAKYTFPLEKKYSNVGFATKVYDQVVNTLIKNGTTTACYFGSLHLEGTLELVKNIIKHGQRGLVGKVSMNVKNVAGYYNETDKELKEVEFFVKKVLAYQNDLVQPVVTPRFALSCDEELMKGLSRISNKYNCRIQSHISENLQEIKFVLLDHPDCKTYAQVYDKCQILNNRCIMAHAIHLTDDEMELMSNRGVSVAHCPASNTRLNSGICPVKKLMDNNITVGLGTDVSGGDSASMMDAMRRAMDVSMYIGLPAAAVSINWREAFYLATLGGAKALGLHDKIGSFEVGKEFDALLVDVYVKGGPITYYEGYLEKESDEYFSSLMQQFIYVGDDRNIIQVYVKGNKVKDISQDLVPFK